MLYDLVLKNRSYRRFDESVEISADTLRELCNLARLSSSAANRQTLKFRLVTSKNECEKVFSNVAWAGYIKDGAPKDGEKPTAYIIILNDNSIFKNNAIDTGIVSEVILLGASEKELGGCMIASFKAESLREALSIPDHLETELVIALGKPVETVVIEDMKDNDVKYWRDEEKVHHVPKRSLDELIV